MAKFIKSQSSFTGGEISPKLYGRTDIEKYNSALYSCLNMIVSPFGGVSRRTGFKYINSSADSTKQSRLIRFEYSATQSYVLEFTHQKIRFYKDQGTILLNRTITNNTFPSNITGWTNSSVGTGAISHDAGNQRLTLTGGGGGNEARATATVLENMGVSQITCTVDIYTSTTTYKVGTTSGATDIATGTLTTGLAKTFNFTPTTNGDVYIQFENTATSSIDNVLLSTPTYVIDSPWSDTELSELRTTQSFDTLYICHPDYAPRKLVRYDHENWELSTVTFAEPAWQDENSGSITMTPSGTTGSVTFTASSATFASSDVGRSIRYKSGPDSSQNIVYPGTGSQTYYDIPFDPQTSSDVDVNFIEATGARTSKTYTAGAPGAGQFTIANRQVQTGDTAATSQRVEIRPKNVGSGKWGWATITAYTSATQVTATVNTTLGGTNASTYWRLGAWSGSTGYPSKCTFHEQRLIFANTVSQPSTVWASCSGDFENFKPDDANNKGTPAADSSLTYVLDTPSIQWIRGLKALLIGCSDGLIQITGGDSSGGGLSATSTPTTKKDTNLPCADNDVTATANEIIFVERIKRKVHSVKYSFQTDGFETQELTLLADHMFANSGVEWMAYADSPGRILWTTRDDGALRSCTYIANQELTAWSSHEIGGDDVSIESITTIPGTTYTELWAVISRTINGGTKRYIECLQGDFNETPLEDAFFIDSGLTYDSTPTTTISGLTHLEGETVRILVDGAQHPDKVVSSGAITLDVEASVVQVGLGYDSLVCTVAMEGGGTLGTNQGTLSRAHQISIRYHDSVSCLFGRDQTNLDIMYFRTANDFMDSAISLYSGIKTELFNGDFAQEYKACIKQDNCLPLTLLAIIFKARVADE